MKKGLIISLPVVAISLAVALWLLSWVPSQSSIPSDVAALAQGGEEDSDEPPKEVGEDLRILFVGDTSFGESYIRKSFIEYRGYDYFLEKLAPLSLGSSHPTANDRSRSGRVGFGGA